ncbi:MAG: bacteriophage holin [Candidatus Thioglobus sp.]|jgi:hypothetical protein|nr:MAG: hypothetical protein Sup05_0899 [uncultured Candidatus Thioglobus sp.]MBT4553802.1 bacteriophage holin [Candidatus Thioglobus sp.]MBT4923698.1 bacteriophage holin [Candidatus Thioglobus sp.]MBT5286360.1 bacteriophage holin [Candidatus Thioglobus sp.]MBT5784431.1 bacteriophage holin [Candidatus Thioglobus sp.]
MKVLLHLEMIMDKKLNPKALALTLGTVWSLGILFVSVVSLMSQSYLHNVSDFLSTLYLGYSLSFFGIIIGMIWAFFDAAIGGFVIAWLYNKLSK